MISRFTQPAQAEFMNTYVPIPFNELAQAGQVLQGRHDAGVQAMDETYAAANAIKAIPTATEGDMQTKNQIVEGIGSVIDEFKGVDLSDQHEITRLRTKIRAAAPADVINRLQNNYASWEQSDQMKRKLMMENRYNEKLDKDPARETTFGSQGEVYDYTPRAYDPKEKQMALYFAGLTGDKTYDPKTGKYTETIDQNKINAIIGMHASDYALTPSGQAEIELHKMQYADQMPEGGWDDNEIAGQLLDEFAQSMKYKKETMIAGYGQDKGAVTTIPGYNEGYKPNIGSGLSGADTNQPTVKEANKQIENLTALATSYERQGMDVPAETATALADLETAKAEALRNGETSYEALRNKTANSMKTAVDNMKIPEESIRPLKDVIFSHIQKNANEKRTTIIKDMASSSGGPMGTTVTTSDMVPEYKYPGYDEFLSDLNNLGLDTDQNLEASALYKQFFDTEQRDHDEAEQGYEDEFTTAISDMTQTRSTFQLPYTVAGDGIKRQYKYEELYEKDFKTGETKYRESEYSPIANILMNFNKDATQYKHEFYDTEGKFITKPGKIKDIERRIGKEKTLIDPTSSRLGWKLAKGGEIIMDADLAGDEAGYKVKLNIVDNQKKQGILDELYGRNTRDLIEAGYHISPAAWGVNHRTSVAMEALTHEEPTQKIALELGMYAMLTKPVNATNEVEVSIFNSDGEPQEDPKMLRSTTQISSYLNSISYNYLKEFPGLIQSFRWAK